MSSTESETMLLRARETVLLPVIWAAIVFVSLQMKFLFPGLTPSVCGPWGCGAETGAIVTMNAGWLAILGPPLIYFPLRLKWRNSSLRKLSLGLFVASLTGILAIVAWQWLVWLPKAGGFSKDYIWQRCGFAVVTAVDWPLIPLLILASILWMITMLWPKGFTNVTNVATADPKIR